MSFYKIPHYISCDTSLLMYSSALNYHLISPLKCYVGFNKFTYEPLENCYFVDPKYFSWRSTYRTQKIWTIFKLRLSKLIPTKKKYFGANNMWYLETKSIPTFPSTLWSRITWKIAIHGKERDHEGYPPKITLLGRALIYLPLN